MNAGPRGTSIRPLGKIFESLREPVYVIGAGQKIEYFNASFAEWIGESASDLVGLEWSGKSQNASLTTLAKSLYPSGVAQLRKSISLSIQPIVADHEEVRPAKNVTFIPLGHRDIECIIAVGDCDPLVSLPAASIDMLAFHNELAAVRKKYPSLGQVGPLIGSTPIAEHLRSQVRLASTNSANVFLVGKRGSGGEQVALCIQSAMPHTPLVTIDGSLMDDELIEATMSPVLATVAGKDGTMATVLFRDIDRMNFEAQSKLLQYLCEYEGKIRCLCLAATSPQECVASGKIGSELALRLSTTQICIPALADRINDLPLIVQSLIDRRSSHQSPIDGIARPAMDLLSSYPFPGDFDELENAIRHAVTHCRSNVIGPSDLPLAIRSFEPADPASLVEDRPINLDRFLSSIELELISRALERSDGNRAEAARRLGISRARLLRRISADGSTETEEGSS